MNPRDYYYNLCNQIISKKEDQNTKINKEPAITLTKRQDEFYDNLFKYFLHLKNTKRI